MLEGKETVDELFKDRLTFFMEQWSGSITALSVAAKRGTSPFLFGVGSVTLGLALFWKLKPFGIQLSDLSQWEFISVVICAFLLMIAGATVNLYQYKQEMELYKASQQIGEKIFEVTVGRSIDAATSMVKPPAKLPKM